MAAMADMFADVCILERTQLMNPIERVYRPEVKLN